MSNLLVAETILQQLGGNKFRAMTGAKNFLGDQHSLQFQLPARFAAKGIRYVKVSLEPSDTYEMTFGKSKGKYEYVEVSSYQGLYFDQLQSIFTRETGLETHL
jgi:hypothetical protein